ncbi:hypothetical protein [Serratia marcescens]|uniref:hypothetical protein n=1 Tax=Serratia marcescens TaxID=615 RepID=UPI003A8377A5
MSVDNQWGSQQLGLISFLDKLWMFGKVAKLAYCLLFLDVFLSFSKGYGVFGLSLANYSDFSFGDVCLFLLSFGVISSVLLVPIELVVSKYIRRIIYVILPKLNEVYKETRGGYVNIEDLRVYALESQSELAYKEYKEGEVNSAD